MKIGDGKREVWSLDKNERDCLILDIGNYLVEFIEIYF